MDAQAYLSLGGGKVRSAELCWAVGKEAHFPGAARGVFAHLGPILGRVQPALIHAMREQAVVSLHTWEGGHSLPEVFQLSQTGRAKARA